MPHRRSRRIALSALLAGLTSAALVLPTGPPAAATSSAAGPVVATWHVPSAAFYDVVAGLGAMWATETDEDSYVDLLRIDPNTNAISHIARYPFTSGGLTVAYGSIWISDYAGNAVWRIAPDGSVQATIGVGLQPQFVHAAFGSLWVSNHHSASLSRIDPRTNTVVASVAVGKPGQFRDGPQAMTNDASRLYATSSNLLRLQRVDPTTNIVSTPPHRAGNDQFCGDLHAVRGFVWSVDPCTQRTYQLTSTGVVHLLIDASPGVDLSQTITGNSVWIGEDRQFDQNSFVGSHATLVQRDPVTGRLLRSVPIGGDASVLRAGFGSLWVYDSVHHTIRRVDIGA